MATTLARLLRLSEVALNFDQDEEEPLPERTGDLDFDEEV
eukprot:CAMPEP_0201556502 /NCGR_PEP_ID=MMETSP0173_2-20130828/55818_1 /ASSEMBLY_ACC=CAM_ASM_000268 /TAXON_ID=218659 /ORGANISM="Vexillifera sp., Strain DIVA3 564/2" /LENGTH=39 /DNA_ID= /DNA_START= /DNA_END= /DNA_ORIENTATION=